MTAPYYPKPAPKRRFRHANWKAGFLVNSRQGTQTTAALDYAWGDFDMGRTKDGTIVNAHGAPEKTWPTPLGNYTWAHLSKLRHRYGGKTYRLRSGAQTIRDNAKAGIGTEFEVKDWKGCTEAEMNDVFARMATFAARAYGPHWRSRFNVKVLTNLSGGLPYALKVCRAAHRAGIPTMILARGKAVRETFRDHPEVTYVRGSKVIK